MGQLKIVIVDYGLGNIMSVSQAFEAIGNPAIITDKAEEIMRADCLIIPGVGAFGDGMKGLKDRHLINSIVQFAKENKPILGICLGMQLLMSESEEFGLHKGLNLISGKVVPLKSPKEVAMKRYKVPNFGWCDIKPPKEKSVKEWEKTLLESTQEGAEVYFVHSFYVKPENRGHLLAITDYGNQEVCAVIKKGNIMGCQFHPEKSGKVGLNILSSFCKLIEKT